MALRRNHYDAAFEEYLRDSRTPYVAVNEQRRSLLHEASLKSMDFIVYSRSRPNLLVDVKGRRFPSGGNSHAHSWENWATEDDIHSLLEWQSVFGEGFRSVLVFAYHIVDDGSVNGLRAPFAFRDRTYAFYGVWADEYRAEMKRRSASWETVCLSSAAFRRLRAPFREFL